MLTIICILCVSIGASYFGFTNYADAKSRGLRDPHLDFIYGAAFGAAIGLGVFFLLAIVGTATIALHNLINRIRP